MPRTLTTAVTWTGLRRPLLLALVLGCSISLMDSGSLTLRLALPAAVWWAFVPLVEILSLFAASRAARHAQSWPATIDRFFTGHTPWLLWIVALGAYWAFLPTVAAFAWPPRNGFWFYSAGVVAAWSAYVDFGFFRRSLKLPPWQAGRDLLLQRVLAWSTGMLIFVASSGIQTVFSRLGL